MKIVTFYTFAEPEKLAYPYEAAIKSCCQLTDAIIVHFGSNRDTKSTFRKFEESSHEKIKDICGAAGVELFFTYDDSWPEHGKLPYPQLRQFFLNGIQKSIDLNFDVFFKVDGDNVFAPNTGPEFRKFIDEMLMGDYISFNMPRKTVLNRSKEYLNRGSKDTYGFNLRMLKHRDRESWIEPGINEWLRYDSSKLGKDVRINEATFIPRNYDCFFFDRKRVAEFMKLSYDLYRFNGRFDKDLNHMSDDDVIKVFATEKLKKASQNNLTNIDKHHFMENEIAQLSTSAWGFDNFGFTP